MAYIALSKMLSDDDPEEYIKVFKHVVVAQVWPETQRAVS